MKIQSVFCTAAPLTFILHQTLWIQEIFQREATHHEKNTALFPLLVFWFNAKGLHFYPGKKENKLNLGRKSTPQGGAGFTCSSRLPEMRKPCFQSGRQSPIFLGVLIRTAGLETHQSRQNFEKVRQLIKKPFFKNLSYTFRRH